MKKIILSIISVLVFCATTPVAIAETVVFNRETLKIHKPGCKWAQKCTVNCIKVDKKEAIKHGGTPCKICGG